jgi:YfiH family protein
VIDLRVAGARVWFTDRHGGVSREPYASANLADHVGDELDAVARNRRWLARALGEVPPDPRAWVWMRQVHGATVVTVDRAPAAPPDADAAITGSTGLPLVVLVADCAPVALVAPGAIGVVHAGWAGLEQGVIARAVEDLRRRGGGPVRAVLGPCVHPTNYEFGAELLGRLVNRFGSEVAALTSAGQPALDVPRCVRVALDVAGVGDFHDVGICTAASPDYFSARAEGITGRQAVVVVRDA